MLSKILMYAELLHNIRQISIVAVLATPSDKSTKADISSDGQQIVLHHDGDVTTLDLPGQVLAQAQLQKCSPGCTELSWRLPAAGTANRVDFDSAQSNDAPWSARHLDDASEFHCRGCDVVALKAGAITDWRDMPSDNWAEMMDFWHCHKPADHGTDGLSGNDEEVAAGKGYGANTKFRARVGVGFVSLTTFLVTNMDCPLMKPAPTIDDPHDFQSLSCTTCHNRIGYVDHDADGFRLFKWTLSLSSKSPLSTPPRRPIQRPSMPSIVSSQMLALIQSQCTSRLLLYPLGWSPSVDDSSPAASAHTSTSALQCHSSSTTREQPFSEFLSIWCLVPSVRISSTNIHLLGASASPSPSPSPSSHSPDTSDTPDTPPSHPGTLAMKVFWRAVSPAEAHKLMDDSGFEQLALPEEAVAQLRASLRASAHLFPASMRTFKEWDTGLLERFEEM